MIKLKNIDLSTVTLCSQIKKSQEEDCELWEAIQKFENNKTLINRNHVIEEFWDRMQADLGVLYKLGISAYDVMLDYDKHIEKIKNRPRD